MRSCFARLRRARPLLGTIVEISVRGESAAARAAIDRAFGAVARIHTLMSFHEADSDVSRLNRSAHRGSVDVDPHTYAVLEAAARLGEASDGAFDVTVAPELVRFGFLPTAAGAPPPARARGFEAIELLSRHRVRFREPSWIDLGGIAKGYAVDVACATLEAAGVRDYVVNAGGDLRVGACAEVVHVRHPACPQALLGLAALTDTALATSAAYFAGRPGAAFDVHPIIEPGTARPARYHGSISVTASDCTTADALTKVVAVRGSAALPLLKRLGAEARLLAANGEWRRLDAPRTIPSGLRREPAAAPAHVHG